MPNGNLPLVVQNPFQMKNCDIYILMHCMHTFLGRPVNTLTLKKFILCSSCIASKGSQMCGFIFWWWTLHGAWTLLKKGRTDKIHVSLTSTEYWQILLKHLSCNLWFLVQSTLTSLIMFRWWQSWGHNIMTQQRHIISKLEDKNIE